jgi:transcriptional regulator with XRE-family HTH domain
VTPEEISLAVGKRLGERRRELRLSLAQVSARCGVSLQQIHKYETGQTPLSVPMLVQLSRCLDAPIAYFLDSIAQAVAAEDAVG